MSALLGRYIQTWHPLVSAMRIIDVRLKDPPANYRSHICKYVGFKILYINVMETTDKGKICVNDVHDLQNLQYQQPIFDQNMRLAIVLEVPVDSQKQLWLKWICQFLRVSDTMFAKAPLSFNSPRVLQKLL